MFHEKPFFLSGNLFLISAQGKPFSLVCKGNSFFISAQGKPFFSSVLKENSFFHQCSSCDYIVDIWSFLILLEVGSLDNPTNCKTWKTFWKTWQTWKAILKNWKRNNLKQDLGTHFWKGRVFKGDIRLGLASPLAPFQHVLGKF